MGLWRSEYNGVLAYSFLVVSLVAMLFGIDDEYKMLMPVLALLLLLLTKRNVIRWNVIDLLLSAIVIYDIMSCMYSRTIALSVRYAAFSVFCFGTYLLFRDSGCSALLFKAGSKERLKIPAYIFYIAIITALLLAVASFFVYRSSVLSAGFGDTYHFRALYRPVGYTCNVWAETGIMLLVLVLLYKRFMLPVGFVAAVAVLLTFSRGAYLSMAIFAVCFLFAVKDNKLRLRLICILVTASMTVALFCPVELRTVVSGNATLSQRQSTEWRTSAICNTLSVIKDAPIMGHGNGSYSMVMDKMSSHDYTGQFTTLAPNIIVQILVEKGIVGILLIGMTAVVVAVRLFRRRNDYTHAVIGCAMIALMVKEMAQATLLANPFVMLLCYTALAFIGDGNKAKQLSSWKNIRRMPMAVCVMSAWMAYLGIMYIDRHDTKIIAESFKLQEKGMHAIAASHIMTAFGNVPTKMEQGILLIKCYVATKDKKYAIQAEDIFLSVKATQKEDLQADLFRAYLYIRQDNPQKASAVLKELLQLHPENGIYKYYMAESYKQRNMEVPAAECLTEAVLKVPRLLDSENMKVIKARYPGIYLCMYENIMRHGSMEIQLKSARAMGMCLVPWGNHARLLFI